MLSITPESTPNLNTFMDYQADAWKRVIDVNPVNVFHCMKAGLSQMHSQDSGGRYCQQRVSTRKGRVCDRVRVQCNKTPDSWVYENLGRGKQ
jgi:NAD(P)-dependent dehydrogenase (short-subunit alcohol dehydrogenase family)